MNQLQILLDRYVDALRATVHDASDGHTHGELMERLAATQRMQNALAANDIARLAAELNEEARILGWGRPSEAVAVVFLELQRVTREMRLEERPDAW